MRILAIILFTVFSAVVYAQKSPTVNEPPTRTAYRELILSYPANEALLGIADKQCTSYTIADILFKHVLNGDLKPLVAPNDTTQVPRADIVRYKDVLAASSSFNVNKLMVYETWIYDEQIKKVRVNILAMAPSYMLKDSTDKPLFWVSYKDFAQLQGYSLPTVFIKTEDNQQHAASLVEYFEARLFQSNVIKDDKHKGPGYFID